MQARVTGAGGFIGSFLAKELIEWGYHVKGLFLPGEDASEAGTLCLEVIRGDLTRPETLAGIAEGADRVFERNNDVDTSRARSELCWTSRVNLIEAMQEIERWVRETYIPNI